MNYTKYWEDENGQYFIEKQTPFSWDNRYYDPVSVITAQIDYQGIWNRHVFWGEYDQDKVKIISNPPATILIVGDVKVVVKAHDEPYDLEKGIAMAITKHIGMTRADMKRLIKKTIVQEPKEEKKKPRCGCLTANYIEF